MPTTELEVQVQTRAEMNTEIRSIAEWAGLDRAWTDAQIDAQIDAEATPESARELAFAAMAQRQAQTRTRTTAQITFDHNDPAVFTSRMGEAIHSRMNPAHELSAPARQYANLRMPDVVREVAKRHGIAVKGCLTVRCSPARAAWSRAIWRASLAIAPGEPSHRL